MGADGASRLKPEHLRVENFNHFNPRVEDVLDTLPMHHRLLHDLVATRGPVSESALADAYQASCSQQRLEPVAPRTLAKYLGELVQRQIIARERGAGTPGWIYRIRS